MKVVTQDEANKPITDVLVEVTKKGASVASAKSTENGETEFLLAPGVYDVTVRKSDFDVIF